MACSDCPVVGDLLVFEFVILDADEQPVDASTQTATIRKPDTTSFDNPVAHTAPGTYTVTVQASEPGQWWARLVTTGPAKVYEKALLVGASQVLV